MLADYDSFSGFADVQPSEVSVNIHALNLAYMVPDDCLILCFTKVESHDSATDNDYESNRKYTQLCCALFARLKPKMQFWHVHLRRAYISRHDVVRPVNL